MATWNIDSTHSGAEFSVRHMMVTTVKGIFENLSGTLNFDEANPANSSVNASIDVSTVNTRVADRDNHLRSADFFDVENYPTMQFVSKSVEVTGDNSGKVMGDLTIRGVTKPATFDVEFFGVIDSPFGDRRVGFNGTATINREDWGLTWNQALENGGLLVSKEVKISVDLQAVAVAESEGAAEA